MTLNEIVSDILLNIRQGQPSQSDKISRNQVILWVNQYRQLIVKQTIDKDKEIDDRFTQVLTVELQQVPISTSSKTKSTKYILESKESLPKLMVLHGREQLLSVFDMNGNPIQIQNKTKQRYQRYRTYSGNDYISYLQQGCLRLEGPELIRYAEIQIVQEDPSDIQSCGMENGPYPMPEDKIPLLKNMIYSQEIGIRMSAPMDLQNNSRDDQAQTQTDVINQKLLNNIGNQLQ